MKRGAARKRILAAQMELRALDTQLDVDLQRFRQQLNPTKLLAGSFAAGFATILLPRRFRAGLLYTFGSVAWPLARLFAPTLLQSALRQMEDDD